MVPVIDFNEFAIQQLPSAQRLPKWVVMAQALLSPETRLYNLLYRYINGSDDLLYWNVSTTYGAGELVKDINGVYESIAGGNTGNATTDPTKWLKVLGSFIGAKERIKYRGNYLTLTYALNRYFGTTFRQPPYPPPYDCNTGSGTFSDIYITNDEPVYVSDVTYPTEPLSSDVYPTYSTGYYFPTPVYATATTYSFVIHIPTAVFTALGSTTAIRNSIVNGFVVKYAPQGVQWRIVTY